MMRDNEGREIEYLRISVTDRCNLRCVYCMPEEGIKMLSHESILTFEEIEKICRIFAKHGLKKVKLTGGEPLVRKGITLLIANLKKIPGIESVTLTTNGVLLEENYEALEKAGIDAITVSLDTLNPEIFQKVTRRNCLKKVLRGVQKVMDARRVPLKINCVPGVDEDFETIFLLLNYARNQNIDVRFIEMMPIGYGKQFQFISESDLKKQIENRYGQMFLCDEKRGNGPAKYYSLAGFKGKIGFISAVSHKFCDTCNRVRLTADGYFKTCLQYEQGVDLKKSLRKEASEQDLWNAMEEAIRLKPRAHHFEEKGQKNVDEWRGMSQIGG